MTATTSSTTPTQPAPKQHRVLVTGSRDWTDTSLIEQALDGALTLLQVPVTMQHTVTLVHGDAKGLDTKAEFAAIRRGWKIEGYPAQWTKHTAACPQWHTGAESCMMAGHRRNHEMIALGADLVVAFPMGEEKSGHSKGTWGCAHAAKAAALPVVVVWKESFFPWGDPAQKLVAAELGRAFEAAPGHTVPVKLTELQPIPF